MNQKVFIYLILFAFILVSLFSITLKIENNTLKQKVEVSKIRLTETFSYNSLFHLFDRVIQKPTQANRIALHSSLMNKESQIRTLLILSLTDEQLEREFNGKNQTILDYKLTDHKLLDETDNNDIDSFKQMKIAWENFRQDTGGDGFIQASDTGILIGSYKKLSETMMECFSKLNK